VVGRYLTIPDCQISVGGCQVLSGIVRCPDSYSERSEVKQLYLQAWLGLALILAHVCAFCCVATKRTPACAWAHPQQAGIKPQLAWRLMHHTEVNDRNRKEERSSRNFARLAE